MESIKTELQINLLKKKLQGTPEQIGNRYNRHYFALKNKIKSLEEKLVHQKRFEFLAK